MLPAPFPDEILISRLLRHQVLSGLSISSYLKYMFGKHKKSLHPYLTGHLRTIAYHSAESEVDLLYGQTIAPLFLHFMPSYKEKISLALVSMEAAEVVRACQLPCFRETEILSIKFCPECARDDANYFGVGYWHRCHQIPGIEACHKHKVWLVHIPWEGRSFLKKGFFPPLDVDSKVCTELSCDLAVYSIGILNQVSHHRQQCFKISNIQQKLRSFGYVTEIGSNRRKLIAKNLYEFTVNLQYPSSDLLPRSSTDFNYTSYILSHDTAQHPFKYLLVDFWLSRHLVHPPTLIEDNVTKVSKSQLDNKCISLLNQGASMAEVSRQTGRSACFG